LLLACEAFQNKEWHFPFWIIFFHLRDIDVFVLCNIVSQTQSLADVNLSLPGQLFSV